MRARHSFLSAVAAGAALLLATPLVAQDTGAGVDMHFGDELDPSGMEHARAHPLGMSLLHAGNRRTPSGHLYQCPIDFGADAALVGAADALVQGSGWTMGGTFRLGFLVASGDEHNANWRRYADFDDGASLAFGVRGEDRASGRWFDARGSRIGEDTHYLRLRGGSAGRGRAEIYQRSSTNVLAHNARSLWGGDGSNRLTLLGGLQPLGSTPAQVAAVLRAQPDQRWQVERDKLGINASYYLDRRWQAYAQATSEDRSGVRPFGGPFFFNFAFPENGGIYETPRPVDDNTLNLGAGVRFVGNLWRADIGYSGSAYRDRHLGYDYEVPFGLYPVVPGAVSVPPARGTFSTEPDNEYHNLRAILGRRLPLDGDLAITLSASSLRQDDELLPPVDCEGMFGIDIAPTGAPGNPFLYDCDDWNSVAALSRRSADLEIANSLFNVRAVLHPVDALSVRASARWLREDYRGTYIAFNPLTGQYGYVAENGSQGSVVPGEMGIVDPVTSVTTRIRNLPLDKETTELELGGDLRVGAHHTLGATWRFVRTDRTHREYETVDEQSLRLAWVNRAWDGLTLRTSYLYSDRDGDDYNFDPYHFTFSRSLPGYVQPPEGEWPHTVAEMRKYDLASRRQHKLNLMATLALGSAQTLSGSLRAERNDYDAVIGRQDYDVLGTSVQWEWQPSPQASASAYYAYDRSDLGMANVNDAIIFGPPDLGGPVYPLDARWWADDAQRNHTLGVHVDRQVGRVRLGADWNLVQSRGVTAYAFASPLALAWPQVAGTTPGRFPTMHYRTNTLTVSAQVPLSERLSLHVFDRYERGRISDWHYLGVYEDPVLEHRVYSDGGPEDYGANLLGVFLEVRL